jgi:hypothetical protein
MSLGALRPPRPRRGIIRGKIRLTHSFARLKTLAAAPDMGKLYTWLPK